MLYAQLARDFGWNAYKTVFNIYDKLPDECRPKTQKEKDNMWMVTFSKVVKRNLCPLFDFWGWQITSIVLEELQTFTHHLPNEETTSAFVKEKTPAQIAKKYCFEFPRSESSSKSLFKNKDISSKNMTTNPIGYTTTPQYSRRSNDLSKYKTHKITSRNTESQAKNKSSAICTVF
jgi:hypothetical protein